MSIDVTVTISNAEEKVLKYGNQSGVAIEDWLRDDIKNKARKVANAVIKKFTEYNPKKLGDAQRVQIINDLDLPEHGAHPEPGVPQE